MATPTQIDITQLPSLASGQIWLGNGSGVTSMLAPTGDVTINSSGVFAIGSGKVKSAMMDSAISISASLTTPVIIGGTGTTSTLSIRPTSGAGTTGADIIFQAGNNGASEFMRIKTVSIGPVLVVGTSNYNVNSVVGDVFSPMIQIVNNANSSIYPMAFFTYGDNTYSSSFESYRMGGTEASPTATIAGMKFASWGFRGHDGSGTPITQSAMAWIPQTINAWSSSDHSAFFDFEVTPRGSTTRSQIVHIGNEATLGFPSQTIPDGYPLIYGAATFPASPSGANYAVNMQVTSVSGSFTQGGYNIDMLAGGTSSTLYTGIRSANAVAGTGTSIFTSDGGAAGVYGMLGFSAPVSTGYAVGVMGGARSAAIAAGVYGASLTNNNSNTNIGVIGLGLNGGLSPIQIGGYFGLTNATPTFVSAALIADNGSTSSPIFIASKGGTTEFIIGSNGTLGISTTNLTSSFLAFHANTTALSQLNLASSSGTDVTSPNDGDLWYNGTNLYFRNGSTSKDLLAGGGGGITGSGTATYVTYWSGSSAVTGSSAFVYDGSKQLILSPGTMADTKYPLSITATAPASVASYWAAIEMQITSSSGGGNEYPFHLNFIAGGTSAKLYAAGNFTNNVAGTGTSCFTTDGGGASNAGIFAFSGG